MVTFCFVEKLCQFFHTLIGSAVVKKIFLKVFGILNVFFKDIYFEVSASGL